jgi:methyl-accepting chemotaxis protein
MGLIALLVVGTLLTVSGVGYYFSKQYLEESMDKTEQAMAAAAAANVMTDLESSLLQLTEVANTTEVKSGNKALILPVMKDAHQRMNKFDHIAYATLDGAAFTEENSMLNVADREYFKKVLSTKKPYIGEPVISRTTNKQTVALVVPVIRDGQLAGMLWGTYSADRLLPLVKTIKFKRQGYGAIMDDSGVYLAHPTRPDLIGKMNLRTGEIAADIKSKLGSNAAIDPKLLQGFKEATEKNARVRIQYKTTTGAVQMGSLNIIPLQGGQRWVLLLTTSAVDANQEVVELAKILVGLALICLFLVLLLTYWGSGFFVRPIVRVSQVAADIAAGNLRDLQKTVYDSSEIGQLSDNILRMNLALRTLVQQVQTQSHQLAASSEELTASAQQSADASNQVAGSIAQMANGAEQQVHAVNETSAVVEQISATIKDVSATAREMSSKAAQAVEATGDGQLAVDKAVTQMGRVGEGAQKAHAAAGQLEAGSKQIAEIVALISNIAGQTNLLALNAAIEAARAGEQGRGFAVVAEEVRKLAEQSESAAQQIKGIIDSNNADIHNVVEAVEAAIAAIHDGVELVNTAGKGFSNIGQQVDGVAAQVNEIHQALDEVATGSQRIVASIKSVEKISRETAAETQNVSASTEEQSASTEEIASSSQSLATLAGDLQTAVSQFRL